MRILKKKSTIRSLCLILTFCQLFLIRIVTPLVLLMQARDDIDLWAAFYFCKKMVHARNLTKGISKLVLVNCG